MNPVVHFEMPYRDAKRAAKFYERAFGWKTNLLGEEMGHYFCVLLLVVLGVSSCFTPEQYDILREEERTITRVIETNKTPDELFTLANFWVVRKFGSTEGFYSDKDAGILIGSARLYTPDAWTGLTFATYTIKIDLVSEDVVTLEIIAGEGYFNYLEIRQRVEPIDREHWNYFIAEGLEQIATDFESNLK